MRLFIKTKILAPTCLACKKRSHKNQNALNVILAKINFITNAQI